MKKYCPWTKSTAIVRTFHARSSWKENGRLTFSPSQRVAGVSSLEFNLSFLSSITTKVAEPTSESKSWCLCPPPWKGGWAQTSICRVGPRLCLNFRLENYRSHLDLRKNFLLSASPPMGKRLGSNRFSESFPLVLFRRIITGWSPIWANHPYRIDSWAPVRGIFTTRCYLMENNNIIRLITPRLVITNSVGR